MEFKTPVGERAVFVAVSFPHPLYPSLALVIWRLDTGWSHDALSLNQDVGEPVPDGHVARTARLRKALLG